MSELAAFRANVQEMFARELGFPFVPGLMEGPNQAGTGVWIGSVALMRVQEMPGRVMEQEVFLTIRAFAPFSGDALISPSLPYDPQPLEEMADRILAAIAGNQTGLGAWFQRVTAIDLDHATQGVQAQMKAYTANPGV
jgi:hypothetical protein